MRIRPRYPRTRARHKRLFKKANKLVRVDVFREGVRAGLDESEKLFRRYDREEIRQRRARNRRQEQMSTRLHSNVQHVRRHMKESRTLTSSAHERRNADGLSTCSMTSIEHTTSNRRGSRTSSSTAPCRKTRLDARDGSAAAWRDATPIFSADASTASVLAPSRARLYYPDMSAKKQQEVAVGHNFTSDRIPPPQPMSSTSSSEKRVSAASSSSCSSFSRMKRIRCGFILCSRANSPRSSHQSAERREKWAISASLTVENGGCSAGHRSVVWRVRKRSCWRGRDSARIELSWRAWFRVRGSISCLYLLSYCLTLVMCLQLNAANTLMQSMHTLAYFRTSRHCTDPDKLPSFPPIRKQRKKGYALNRQGLKMPTSPRIKSRKHWISFPTQKTSVQHAFSIPMVRYCLSAGR